MGFVWALVLCRLGQADTVVVFGLLLLPNRTEESAHSKKKTIEKGAGPKTSMGRGNGNWICTLCQLLLMNLIKQRFVHRDLQGNC